MKILETRIQSLIRRTLIKTNDIEYGPMRLIIDEFVVKINGVNIELTQTEYDIVKLLVSNPNKVFSRNELIDRVLGHDVIVTERTIDVHIRNIRSKLNEYSGCMKSIRGRGYVFRDDFDK